MATPDRAVLLAIIERARVFTILRGWVRERAAALNVPPYRVRPDREIDALSRLELPAAAWCIVAPCR